MSSKGVMKNHMSTTGKEAVDLVLLELQLSSQRY